MPPKKNTISPTKAHPYIDGDILLISNYKPEKKDYFQHASNAELTSSILATMQEKTKENNSNMQANVTIFAPMPGRMYFLNRTFAIVNHNPEVKISPSLKKLQPEQSSSKDIQLVHLDNECDLDAYDEIKRWITSQNQYIVAAADQFLVSNPGWDIHILTPHINRELDGSALKKAELTEIDLFEQNRPNTNKNDGSRPTITINFLHQWPDLYSPQDKIKELANFVAHFNKGQKLYIANPSDYEVFALTSKAESIANHNIDLQKLTALQEEDLKVLCDTLKISYENYGDDKTQPGLKTTLKNLEAEGIDQNSAVNAFFKTCVLSFNNFSGSKNGQEARERNNKDPEQNKSLITQTFWGNILFMAAELPLLILASGQPDGATKKVGYNQDPKNENLQLISEISTAVGRGVVNFYQPAVEKVDKKFNTTNNFPAGATPSGAILVSNERKDFGSSSGSNNSNNSSVFNTAGKEEPLSAKIYQLNNETTEPVELGKTFTKHVNLAIAQICSPKGQYDVYLALDFLKSILGWYANNLNTILGEEFNQETYEKRDMNFWLNIKSISSSIQKDLSHARMHQQLPFVENVLKTACDYLEPKQQQETRSGCYSAKTTYTSRNTLNAWWDKVMEVKNFEIENPSSTASAPEEPQNKPYLEAKQNAYYAFTSLATSSKGTETLQELKRTTQTFADNVQGRKPFFDK